MPKDAVGGKVSEVKGRDGVEESVTEGLDMRVTEGRESLKRVQREGGDERQRH